MTIDRDAASTSAGNNQTTTSDGDRAEENGAAPRKSIMIDLLIGLGRRVRRHWVLSFIFLMSAAMLGLALMPRDTLFVADAHSEIVTLEKIDGTNTSIPLAGATLCMPPDSIPQWAVTGDRSLCGAGLVPGLAPVGANAIEPAKDSRAVISRLGNGPLRIYLSVGEPAVEGSPSSAGKLVGDGTAWNLPSLVFVVIDPDDQRSGRVVSFRASAEIGDQGGSQRLLYDGSLEIFRRGAVIERFVSRRARLRTGDTIQFYDGFCQRAKVSGIAAAAPGESGGLRVTMQATGLPNALFKKCDADAEPTADEIKDMSDKFLTYGAEISRVHADPYRIEAGFFDNLLSDPVYIYFSGLLVFVGILASALSVFERSGGNKTVEAPPDLPEPPGPADPREPPDGPVAVSTDEDGELGPAVPRGTAGFLIACLAAGLWISDARAEFRQVDVRGTPNLGQGFLVASGGLCYAIMPRHLLVRPDGIIAGRAVLAPEGSQGRRVGARLYAEFPFDAVLLETEGTPPGGCGPSIHAWRPDVRQALRRSGAVVLRSVSADGGVRTLPLTVEATNFTGLRVAPSGNGYIQQTMSGSLIVKGDVAMAMLLRSEGDYSGSGMNMDQILASARIMLGAPNVARQQKPAMTTDGNTLSLATAGAKLITSSAAPFDPESGAAVLLGALEGKGRFRAVAPRGVSLEIDLAGENARPIGCIRFDFSGVPTKERPRSVSIGLSAVEKGAYLPSGTIAISSIDDVTDRPFGLPQRARRLTLHLQRSQHPDGILAMRRLIVLEATGSAGGCS